MGSTEEGMEDYASRRQQEIEKVLCGLIEITLAKRDDFLIIEETLSRIGVAVPRDKTLYQSCHIFHKQGRYYITHFKQMLQLDGKQTNFSEDDHARVNTIANMLARWKLLTLVDPVKSLSPTVSYKQIDIIPYREKKEWNLVTKYSFNKRKKEAPNE